MSYRVTNAGEVGDEQGRRRFHGAFTGGFSAGYFNTVGSAEGWTPAPATSSRQRLAAKAEAARRGHEDPHQQHPEDFFDAEDDVLSGQALRMTGLYNHRSSSRNGGKTFLGRRNLDTPGPLSSHAPGKYPSSVSVPVSSVSSSFLDSFMRNTRDKLPASVSKGSAGSLKRNDSVIPGFHDAVGGLRPQNRLGTSSIGKQMLKTMGWREGQGTGARRLITVPQTVAIGHGDQEVGESNHRVVELGRRDDVMEVITPKLDRFGLGYHGSLRMKHGALGSLFTRTKAHGDDSERNRLSMSGISSSSAAISFGLGVLDDNGDDGGYLHMASTGLESTDMSQFHTSISLKEGSEEDEDTMDKMGKPVGHKGSRSFKNANLRIEEDIARWKDARCEDGTRPLAGFHVYKESRKDNAFSIDNIKRLKVPQDFRLRHRFSRFEVDQHQAARMWYLAHKTKNNNPNTESGQQGQLNGSAPPDLFSASKTSISSSTDPMSVLPPELADEQNRNSLSNRFASSGNMSGGLNKVADDKEIGLTFYKDAATRTKKNSSQDAKTEVLNISAKKITHQVLNWQPARLLCKRFGVPVPSDESRSGDHVNARTHKATADPEISTERLVDQAASDQKIPANNTILSSSRAAIELLSSIFGHAQPEMHSSSHSQQGSHNLDMVNQHGRSRSTASVSSTTTTSSSSSSSSDSSSTDSSSSSSESDSSDDNGRHLKRRKAKSMGKRRRKKRSIRKEEKQKRSKKKKKKEKEKKKMKKKKERPRAKHRKASKANKKKKRTRDRV